MLDPLLVGPVGIVGLGTIGMQEMALWSRAGMDPAGYDISASRLREVASESPDLRVASSLVDLADCTVIIACLPNLDASGHLSLAPFDRFVEDYSSLPARERLLVVASTVPVGFSRRLQDRLAGQGALVAHAPERFDPGRGVELGEITRVIGATGDRALQAARELYSAASVPTHVVEPIEVAEAAKLLENSFRLLNIAFIDEFAELCRGLDISAADVIGAAATKPFGFMAHNPGAGAGGTCVPTVPRFLLEAAAERSTAMPILDAAVASNDGAAERIAAELRRRLREQGIQRGRVLLAGVTYKPNYPDLRGSAALKLARRLAQEHDVAVLDPIVDAQALEPELEVLRTAPDGRFDAVVVAVRHKVLDLDLLRELSPTFLDLVRGEARQGATLRG